MRPAALLLVLVACAAPRTAPPATTTLASGAAPAASAATSALPQLPPDLPRLYVYEGGNGTLEIAGNDVVIDTVGANAHLCHVEGKLAGARIVSDDLPECTIELARSGADAHVEANEACAMYCGARARFAGTYRAPPPGCAPAEVDAVSKRPTAKELEKIIATCTDFVDRFQAADLRGQLAAEQAKAGRWADCLATLEPVHELATSTDQALRDGWPPADAESFIAIATPLRATFARCRKKKR